MEIRFKSVNTNSPGLITTYILLLILSGLFFFAAFNTYNNDGRSILFFLLLFLGSIGPIVSFLHLKSEIIIKKDELIKKSILRTKKYSLRDFKSIHITDTVVGQYPIVIELDEVSAKKEKLTNFFTIRHINLNKEKSYNPYRFNNLKKVVSLPYYPELYELLKSKIKNSPQ